MTTHLTELTPNEVKLIAAIRSLHPFEKITIVGDKSGKVGKYFVQRSYTEIWIEEVGIVPVDSNL